MEHARPVESGFFPLDEELGLLAGNLTPHQQKSLVRLCVQMPFAEASFDAAVASLAIHNVPGRQGRSAAVNEIARVLRPGSRVALLDFARTGEYVDTLRALGWTDVRRTGYSLHMFPPVRIVRGSRPAARP